MNGRGVHILKAGSKRRRTKADINEEFEFEREAQENASQNASKVKEQRAALEALEKELQEREARLNQGHHLFEWLERMVHAGKIRIDGEGLPNIIGNEDDQDFDDN